MEYKIGNITFSKETKYNKALYWKLYKSFSALRRPIKDLTMASELAGGYGLLLCKDVIPADEVNDDLYEYLRYRDLLLRLLDSDFYNRRISNLPSKDAVMKAKSLEELKKLFDLADIEEDAFTQRIIKRDKRIWGVEVENKVELDFNIATKRYYNKIVRGLPENILNKVQNIELFKMGYIEKNVYDELMTFKDELKAWLENPTGTDIHYDIDGPEPELITWFHDQIFDIKKTGDRLEINGDELTVIDNCKTILLNKSGEEIINDYTNPKDYAFTQLEGFNEYGINIKNSTTKEFLLEVCDNKIDEIIIEVNE